MFQLKSHDALANTVAARLVDGNIVVLRAMPGSGRSTLLSSVAKRYCELVGCKPHTVAPYDESDPEAISEGIRQQVSEFGQAALLLDDWGRIVRASPQTPWQQRITRLCVDGPLAESVGTLVIGAPGENLSRFGDGASPLIDAAHVVYSMPLLNIEEIVHALCESGVDKEEAPALAAEFGASVVLLRKLVEGRLDANAIEESILSAAYYLQADAAQRIIDLSRKENLELAADEIDVRLSPIAYTTDTGRTALGKAFYRGGIRDLVTGSGHQWPSERSSRVRRFHCRIFESDSSFWYDRYLSSALPEIIEFLEDLSVSLKGKSHTVRLLSGKPLRPIDPAIRAEFTTATTLWRQRGLHVLWHILQKDDIQPLHDRQLVSRSRLEGHHLPPADRLVGKLPAGNENDALLQHAPLSAIENAWSRSKCLMCTPNACDDES